MTTTEKREQKSEKRWGSVTSQMPVELDPARVARARALTVEQVGEGQYRVHKVPGDAGRLVRLDTDGKLPCSCPDQTYRHETACKHLIAVLMYRLMVELPQKAQDAAPDGAR